MTKGIRFSNVEKGDLLKAWAVLSLAFAIVITGTVFTIELLKNILISGLTVGIGFIFHELGHKVVAQKYGYFAEFRANYQMLVIALMSSFFGFLFAAPGAVVVGGHISKSKYGRISLAGPLMSIAIALVFFIIGFISSTPIIASLSSWGFKINAWLAVFNLIPFGPLDGRKIMDWNKATYFITAAVAVGLMWLSFQ
jgi:Zn-dependent protease